MHKALIVLPVAVALFVGACGGGSGSQEEELLSVCNVVAPRAEEGTCATLATAILDGAEALGCEDEELLSDLMRVGAIGLMVSSGDADLNAIGTVMAEELVKC
jgi:hypothetical protein